MESKEKLESVISLLNLPIGGEAVIIRMHHGKVFNRRMLDIGIREGMKIKRLTPEIPFKGGSIAIQINGGTCYCLGNGEAFKIDVQYDKNGTN